MFVLAEMKDTVRIPPWLFNLDTKDAIIETLNKKLANKVMYNVGLCIALWDIEKFEDSYIFPGDGASHTIVHFRYVVFRPFVDEILIGKIKGSSKEGVMVSIGFFDDILIPADSMQHPSKFDEQEQLWYWEYQLEDGNKHTLFMDIGEQIRFRIVDEMFTDTTPCGPDGGIPDSPEIAVLDPESRKSPFSLTDQVSFVMQLVVGSIPYSRPPGLCLITVNAPLLVYQRQWDLSVNLDLDFYHGGIPDPVLDVMDLFHGGMCHPED